MATTTITLKISENGITILKTPRKKSIFEDSIKFLKPIKKK